jgi:hypothetical protein
VSYTIICRTKLNWPVDASMRLEFDITTGAKSEIETLERKCRHVYTNKNGVGVSSCDVSLLCLSTIERHSHRIAGVLLGQGRAYRPLPSGSLRMQHCDE